MCMWQLQIKTSYQTKYNKTIRVENNLQTPYDTLEVMNLKQIKETRLAHIVIVVTNYKMYETDNISYPIGPINISRSHSILKLSFQKPFVTVDVKKYIIIIVG